MRKYVFLLLGIAPTVLHGQENQIAKSDSSWKFSAWADMFIIPGEEDYFNPTFYARHKSLHLEGRYNYEDRNTASLWAGKRFQFGEEVEFVLVPMAGIVVGNTNGAAPGFETEVAYKKLDFYGEGEYVFDFESKEGNFFYMYSEMAITPLPSLRTGLTAQRTRLFKTTRDVQRGLFAEYYFGRCRAGIFAFNPFNSDNYWIASFSVDF
jgi:hypothetical protein